MLRRRGRPPSPGLLTPAEERVLGLVRQGMTNPEIAAHLGISVNTVRFHVSNLLSKAGVESRAQLTRWMPERDLRAFRWLALPGLKLIAGGLAGLAAVVVVGMVAAALLGDSDDPVQGFPSSDPVLPRYNPDSPQFGQDDVGVGGTMVREGRCLYIDTEWDGEPRRFLLVFPPDEGEWDSEAGALLVHGRFFPPGAEAGFSRNDPRILQSGGSSGVAARNSSVWTVPPDPSCQAEYATYVDTDQYLVNFTPTPLPPSVPGLPVIAAGTYVAQPGVFGVFVLEGRCLYIEPVGTGQRLLLALQSPADATWDPIDRALVVDGRAYRLGSAAGTRLDDPQVLPIGSIGLGTDAPAGYWVVPPDPTCEAEASTFIFTEQQQATEQGGSGLPVVTLTPDRGSVGTAVHLEGEGFTDAHWQTLLEPGAGYGIFLDTAIRSGSEFCELVALAEYTAQLSADGHLTADFTVPSEGNCFQSDRSGEPVLAGTYQVGLGCHACLVAEFIVTDP